MGFGRAAVMPSSPDKSATNIFELLKEKSQSESDRQLEKTLNLNLHQRNTKSFAEQPAISLVNLDLSFSRIGTWAQLLRILFSSLKGSSNTNDPNTTKTRGWDIVDDALHKLRQLTQYSIHGQPCLGMRNPDGVTADMVENMLSHDLGRRVYNYHAFVAPWIGLTKMFFPYSDNPITGLIPRLVDSFDNVMNKMTNLFWNMRTIAVSLLPYNGLMKSEGLTQTQNKLREILNFYWEQHVEKYFSLIYNSIFKRNDISFDPGINHVISDEAEKNIKQIAGELITNFKNNFHAIYSDTYKSSDNQGLEKKVGEEEPLNEKWYVRLKLLSKFISLPAGTVGAICNITGMVLNSFGSVFNFKAARDNSNKLMDFANGLMSLVYMTHDVPANINELIKKKKYDDIFDIRNLLVFMVGAVGMLNRIKILPVFNQILGFTKIKSFLDNFDNTFKHYFLWFFSYNRLVVHSDETAKQKLKASSQDLQKIKRHENLWSHLFLPFRVMMGDNQVSYSRETNPLVVKGRPLDQVTQPA